MIQAATTSVTFPEANTGDAFVDLGHVQTLLDVIIDTTDEMTAMTSPEAMQRLSRRCMDLGLIAHDLVRRAQNDLNPAPTAIIATFARSKS